jgi:hypothetical protein
MTPESAITLLALLLIGLGAAVAAVWMGYDRRRRRGMR